MKIKVRVMPRAKKMRIEKFNQGLKVYLCESATNGRANKKLIEILAAHYKTKKYNVSITSGLKQKDKTVEISGIN